MRRLLYLLLFPVVWVPLLLLMLLAIPALPWWAWPVAVAFWVVLILRRRAGAAELGPAAEGGVSWSPTRRGGGLW